MADDMDVSAFMSPDTGVSTDSDVRPLPPHPPPGGRAGGPGGEGPGRRQARGQDGQGLNQAQLGANINISFINFLLTRFNLIVTYIHNVHPPYIVRSTLLICDIRVPVSHP